MVKNIVFKELEINDIHENLLHKFNRFQKVKMYYRKENGGWVIKDTNYAVNWTDWKIKEIINVFIYALNNGGIIAGAYENDRLIGFAILLNDEEYGKQYMKLEYMFVTLEYRHKGVGTHLFKLCTDKACEKGVEKILILAADAEETQRFLFSLGFVDVKEQNEEYLEKYPNHRQLEYALNNKVKSG